MEGRDVQRVAARLVGAAQHWCPLQQLRMRMQLLDRDDTERYSVEVPDGTRTESYSARVACGQDCTTTPRTCPESRKSDKNGLVTLRYDDRDLSFEVLTPETLQLFAPGSRHRLHREDGKLSVDGSAITPLEQP